MSEFERYKCAKQPCDACKDFPSPSRECVHEHCPSFGCIGAEPPLIERVREWSRKRYE